MAPMSGRGGGGELNQAFPVFLRAPGTPPPTEEVSIHVRGSRHASTLLVFLGLRYISPSLKGPTNVIVKLHFRSCDWVCFFLFFSFFILCFRYGCEEDFLGALDWWNVCRDCGASGKAEGRGVGGEQQIHTCKFLKRDFCCLSSLLHSFRKAQHGCRQYHYYSMLITKHVHRTTAMGAGGRENFREFCGARRGGGGVLVHVRAHFLGKETVQTMHFFCV